MRLVLTPMRDLKQHNLRLSNLDTPQRSEFLSLYMKWCLVWLRYFRLSKKYGAWDQQTLGLSSGQSKLGRLRGRGDEFRLEDEDHSNILKIFSDFIPAYVAQTV